MRKLVDFRDPGKGTTEWKELMGISYKLMKQERQLRVPNLP